MPHLRPVGELTCARDASHGADSACVAAGRQVCPKSRETTETTLPSHAADAGLGRRLLLDRGRDARRAAVDRRWRCCPIRRAPEPPAAWSPSAARRAAVARRRSRSACRRRSPRSSCGVATRCSTCCSGPGSAPDEAHAAVGSLREVDQPAPPADRTAAGPRARPRRPRRRRCWRSWCCRSTPRPRSTWSGARTAASPPAASAASCASRRWRWPHRSRTASTPPGCDAGLPPATLAADDQAAELGRRLPARPAARRPAGGGLSAPARTRTASSPARASSTSSAWQPAARAIEAYRFSDPGRAAATSTTGRGARCASGCSGRRSTAPACPRASARGATRSWATPGCTRASTSRRPRARRCSRPGQGWSKSAGRNRGYGNYLRLRHNRDYATAYAHLATLRARHAARPAGRAGRGDRLCRRHRPRHRAAPALRAAARTGRQVNPLSVDLAGGEPLQGADAGTVRGAPRRDRPAAPWRRAGWWRTGGRRTGRPQPL